MKKIYIILGFISVACFSFTLFCIAKAVSFLNYVYKLYTYYNSLTPNFPKDFFYYLNQYDWCISFFTLLLSILFIVFIAIFWVVILSKRHKLTYEEYKELSQKKKAEKQAEKQAKKKEKLENKLKRLE